MTVNISIVTGQSVGGGRGTDTLTNIENIAGSSFSDVLTGDSGSNVLTGAGGADNLTGGLGADTFRFTTFTDSQPGVGLFDTVADFKTTYCRHSDTKSRYSQEPRCSAQQ